MNYSSVAGRAIEIVNRMLIAAMTSAWTSALDHHPALPASEENCDADECLERESAPAANLTERQH